VKTLLIKKTNKQERELHVLLGLVDRYILTARPVGSNTLKEAGFDNLSSATIRNYFAHLEQEGFLTQQHASGGRIPTAKAYRLYAHTSLDQLPLLPLDEGDAARAALLRRNSTEAVSTLLQHGAEELAATTQMALFLSSPRFDHDYISTFKLLPIDASRCLCIVITDFGVVRTELLVVDRKIPASSVKRIESYFHWRISGFNRPRDISGEEEAFAQTIYNEVMVRYLVNYTNFIDEELYRTGFSRLLAYPEMQCPEILAHSLALFENSQSMRLILRECSKMAAIKIWMEQDLLPYSQIPPPCAILAIPYRVNKQPAGAIGLLGPMRIPYRRLIATLTVFAEAISDALTQCVYKHKISIRQPHNCCWELENGERLLIEHIAAPLLTYPVDSTDGRKG